MAPKRALPKRMNPLVSEERAPQYEILVERRRLGQTKLDVRAGQVGTSNATQASNLGPFDYAHLRVPLPTDLEGSGIFKPTAGTHAYPESYFLMRRSNDGFVSATGMFKAAFPWASKGEEETEREHQKTLQKVAEDEIAGNIWVAPEQALQLAKEYGMKTWIAALLDPEPIEKGTKDKDNVFISTPPKFDIPNKADFISPSADGTASTRKRSKRSVSPSKIATPSRKLASPRKPRTSRKTAKADDTEEAKNASNQLQDVLTNGALSESAPTESEALQESAVDGDTIRVTVDEVTRKDGDAETTTTSVKVDLPAGSPQLPLPESTEEMIAQARAMVEEANKADGKRPGSSKGRKRKADVIEDDEEVAGSSTAQPSKKLRILEEDLKKKKIQNRALTGIAATALVGAFIANYFM